MNALTREALSPVARGCRRDMGGVGASPRLAHWAWARCVPPRRRGRRVASVARRGLVRGANPDPRNLEPERRAGRGLNLHEIARVGLRPWSRTESCFVMASKFVGKEAADD